MGETDNNTSLAEMRNDVIESIITGLTISFKYKADGGIITTRTVRVSKFYQDFEGFVAYDTDKEEDRNFRFDRVEEWYGRESEYVDWEIEIFREGQRLESYTVVAKDEDEAREIFKSGEYNFNFSHDFASDNEPEDSEIESIEVV